MSINLTRAQLETLINKNKSVGSGTDGVCYRQGKKVYKIYHTSNVATILAPMILDSSGVRIHSESHIKDVITSDRRIIKYTDYDGIKLSTESGLIKAIERGKNIRGTNLPSDIIYVDGRARGCVYPYYKHASSIYKTYRRSLKTRLKICRELYIKVKELIDNNIYPVDLCQKSREKLFDKKYCNVFLGPNNEPIIIDLDGKSALYTEVSNLDFERKTCDSLMTLLIELVTREDLQEDMTQEAFDEIRFYLKKAGLSVETIEKFFDCTMTMEDVNKGLEELGRGKIK